MLKDIWLSFYPGAKIGVLGRNGSGKSTLLRIMAGIDKDFDGEAALTDGFTVGYLPQEPQLNPDKDVCGNVEEAVAPTRALLDRYDEINAQARRADRPRRDGKAARPSRPRCRTRSSRTTPGSSTGRSKSPWTR